VDDERVASERARVKVDFVGFKGLTCACTLGNHKV